MTIEPDDALPPFPEPPDAEPATPELFPWPPTPERGIATSFVATWRESLFETVRFYRKMPIDGLWSGALYYVLVGIIAAGARLFWGNIFDITGVSRSLSRWSSGEVPTSAERLVDFLLSPVWLLVTLFAVAAVIHLVVIMLVPDRKPFTATTRVLAFSYSPLLFTVVPFVGSIIGGVWSLVLAVVGLREVHQTTTGRAIAAILLPLALAAFIGMLMAFMAGLIGLSALRGAG